MLKCNRLLGYGFIRYLMVGIVLFMIDWVVFYSMLLVMEASIDMAQIVSRACGASCGFVVHKYFSFRELTRLRSSRTVYQGFGYFLVALFNIMISPLLLNLVLMLTADTLFISKIILEMILVLQTYLLMLLVFRWDRLALFTGVRF
ncbi:GtrA family protein [Halochromatium roseum]|uniref:GtrA family protein n=1 Tax=Halochromatium roseum TaxID=391920 RepID=UPI0019112AC3|nr:GtrA family protein [Halochromatium roseum]